MNTGVPTGNAGDGSRCISGYNARTKKRHAQPQQTVYPMKFSYLARLGIACSLAVAALPSPAAEPGDAAAGKEKNSMCIGCHAIGGYKTAFPEVYSVPKIGGQHAAYIVKALQEYKSGARSHPSMRAIAAGLSDKDMADLAAYYATDSMKSAAK
jgi:cytochrome c553